MASSSACNNNNKGEHQRLTQGPPAALIANQGPDLETHFWQQGQGYLGINHGLAVGRAVCCCADAFNVEAICACPPLRRSIIKVHLLHCACNHSLKLWRCFADIQVQTATSKRASPHLHTKCWEHSGVQQLQ